MFCNDIKTDEVIKSGGSSNKNTLHRKFRPVFYLGKEKRPLNRVLPSFLLSQLYEERKKKERKLIFPDVMNSMIYKPVHEPVLS